MENLLPPWNWGTFSAQLSARECQDLQDMLGLRLWKLINGPQEADLLSTERPTWTKLNRAELHTSCPVCNALEIKSRDRQLMGASTVLCMSTRLRSPRPSRGDGAPRSQRRGPNQTRQCNSVTKQTKNLLSGNGIPKNFWNISENFFEKMSKIQWPNFDPKWYLKNFLIKKCFF